MSNLFIGNMFGEHGAFLQHVIPVLNALKEQHYTIEYCGYNEHQDYLKRLYKGNPIDIFYGFDWWTEGYKGGFVADHIPKEAIELYESKKNIIYWPITELLHDNYAFYLKQPKIARRFIATNISEYKDSIVIFPRKKSSDRDLSPEFWHIVIQELAKQYKVYVIGNKYQTYINFNGDNITNLCDDPDRVNKQIDILNNCLASISCMGGGGVTALRCGTPILFFSHPYFSGVDIEEYNPFRTTIEFVGCDPSTYSGHDALPHIFSFINRKGSDRSKVIDEVSYI